jgi:hypothetical protein
MISKNEVSSIEIDMTVYRREKIIIRDNEGKAMHVIEPKPGTAEAIYKELIKRWWQNDT